MKKRKLFSVVVTQQEKKHEKGKCVCVTEKLGDSGWRLQF